MTTTPISVLCVDDHRLIREGITTILSMVPGITVVGEACDGREAVALYDELRPDVTLMDLQMPRCSGLDAIVAIRRRHADARIVVLTMYQGDEDVFGALRAGAAGYVLKDSLSADLIHAIREVHRGRDAIPPDLVAKLSLRHEQAHLTAREMDVLRTLVTGMRNKEIAVALDMAEDTVRTHIKKIFAKLEVHDRTAALAEAVRRGLIRIEPK